MNLKKIEKAGAIIRQIQNLDAAIIEIDRFAMLIANQDSPCVVTLRADDEKKKAEEDAKVRFDKDGSLINNPGIMSWLDSYRQSMLGGFSYGGLVPSATPKDTRVSLDAEFTNSETLQVLGILLGNKQAQRQKLLHQLEQMGVKI